MLFFNILALTILFNVGKAQEHVAKDLLMVEVRTFKFNLSQLGKRTEVADSLTKENFRFSSLAEVLAANSQMHIKSYGPGGIATTALRGGNASQTAVLWNGFNLQNAMLGQTDLALLPATLFDNIEVEYGGSSALWGSGAVGGSIRLNNSILFSQGFKSITNLGIGNFGRANVSTILQYSYKRFVSKTRLYVNAANNNYSYRDTTDKENPIKKQSHAAYNMLGIMQELKFWLFQNQILSVNIWLNNNLRQIPAVNTNIISKTGQQDKASRFALSWTRNGRKLQSNIRSALFNEQINYNDTLQSSFSKSKAITFIVENENHIIWAKKHQLVFGLNFQNSKASTQSYLRTSQLTKLAALISNKLNLYKDKLQILTAARLEQFSNGRLPLTGNISAEYAIFKKVRLSFNSARVYRHPTLNELYWQPGGNPKLNPEQGYTFEGTAACQSLGKKIKFSLSASAYSRVINNWILWLPGPSGNPSPLNVQKVWSRGTETNWSLGYEKQKLKAGIKLNSAYVLSTVESTNQENSAAKNKQLIYTPRYSLNGNIWMIYNKTSFTFYHQYTGYRFTNSDNTAWLNPFYMASIKMTHTTEFSKALVTYFLTCNNIFNSNYVLMAGQPMPLRAFEFGISIQTKKQIPKT